MPVERVAVLYGGPSAEREVSLKSGAACASALAGRGHDVVLIDVGADLAARLAAERVTVCFNALHGKWGEDGCVQGLLELARIPYTGPGVLGSAMAMDKFVTKTQFAAANIPVPPYIVLAPGDDAAAVVAGLSPPWVVKPVAEGSSFGVTILDNAAELPAALAAARAHDARVIVEGYVRGREINVGVLDYTALGLVEVRPKPVPGERFTFYDYAHKYTRGMTDYVTDPGGIEPDQRAELFDLAERAARALFAEGAVRVDFLVAESGDAFVLEVNTLPGMTELSLLPMVAHDGAGLSFADLVERILATARLKVGS
ncbi:D-alanine--D-alanine ligase [bacterium]|nr:D-alanine--D-alanine ligase [bacterium]